MHLIANSRMGYTLEMTCLLTTLFSQTSQTNLYQNLCKVGVQKNCYHQASNHNTRHRYVCNILDWLIAISRLRT